MSHEERSAVEVEPLSGSAGDLAVCRAIERESFGHEQLDLEAELARAYARVWVARASGEVRGFLLAWWLGGELEIQTVATATSARRRGVGASLVAAALAEARAQGAERVLLEVRASNEPALALYRRAGFVEDGRRRGYYSDPVEDAVLMSLSLAR